MNLSRRNFIRGLLAVGAAFTVLPPAAVGRVWKATKPELVAIVNPDWILAPYEMAWHVIDSDSEDILKTLRVPPEAFPLRFSKDHKAVPPIIRVPKWQAADKVELSKIRF
jgi:hypothetical protein